MARMTTIPSSNPGGHKANGSAGVSFGAVTSGGGTPARKQPLPHIDDITSVTIDFDRYTPMDKLLGIAENLLREAETYRTFGGRIDMAMKSYIKANILLLDVVKKNKGWASLQADNKAQKQRYNTLVRQAQAGHSVFEQIKSEIKTDNARSGVHPTVDHPQHAGAASTASGLAVPKDNRLSLEDVVSSDGILTPASSPTPSTAKSSVGPTPASFTTPAKAKPLVRPKPEALHGNAVQPSGVAAKKAAEDLSKRFANLRPSTSAPPHLLQDPRIRTQPIVVPPAATQRRDAAVSTSRPSLSLESSLYELPKVPGAIYKPARGTVSTEAAELPSSSSRRFSLARSLTSGSLNSPSVKTPLAGPSEESNDWAKRAKLTIPEGETLSVTELLRLMKEGSKSVSILLIDIRSREAFDEGHIMSQATICIEPEVLMRKNISASEIAESMVLAPSAEQINFERRHGFDLVVFYDQDSTRIGTKKGNPDGVAVQGLYNALSYFDFVGETSPKPPKLLEGGLDAWTSVMGSSSLATTETSVGRPLTSPTTARQSMYSPARRKSYVPKPIQDPDEARRWEQSTNDPDTFRPAQNVEDFFRRFPPVSDVKESMVSPPGISTVDGNYSVSPPNIPAEPARPAPTVAKTSFSGFNGKDEHNEAKKLVPRSKGDKKKGRLLVGLRNRKFLCYANSSLQALFWTDGFADDLFTGQWARDFRVPMKEMEKIPNPQLLAKMLAQLFAWMQKALIEPMEARTLMQYMQHISSKDSTGRRKPEAEIFGNPEVQHDTQEFFNYVMAALHDETNIHRDQREREHVIDDNDRRSLLHNSIKYWHTYTAQNDSIVTKYWRGMEIGLTICRRCNSRTVTAQTSDLITCPIEPGNLAQSLEQFTGAEFLTDYKCLPCQKHNLGLGESDRRLYFSRLPDRMALRIERGTVSGKNMSRFTFPLQNLDMEPYFIPKEPKDERRIDRTDARVAETADTERQFRPPFKYDCYAVICHNGRSLTSGHYIAYVRDPASNDPTDWIRFNDAAVDYVKVGSNSPDDVKETFFGKGDQQAYLMFYERKA